MGNNWVNGTDPDGRFFFLAPIIIGATVGAFIGGVQADMQGKPFLEGAWKGGLVGGATGLGGAFVGQAVVGAIGFGGFAGGAMAGAASGFTGGFIGGAGNAWITGATFNNGLVTGLENGGWGALTGGILGGIAGGIDAIRNHADFWNGKVIEVGGFGSNGKYLDENIPAGHKPTATGEIAKTSSNPNYGKYGKTRMGGTKPHFGVDYVGKEGDDVFAMYDGKVTRIGGSKFYGKNFVRTSSTINNKLYNVDYEHMSEASVTLNKTINAGNVIGKMGRLGNLAGTSFPTHVHIAIWRPVSGGLQGFVQPWWK
jgi:hypothetical protein